ncbi:uncharacterized protein LOC110712496 [Chenopodium quinoa]|uniref:uncharacterized protein LOC110712496 n=1 Tax=Chenopodium quinoa TaxID=63459 RepID=UPI000B79144A|nr:uncharacterized protein LOC110712496 [Chenopodium quinoa]
MYFDGALNRRGNGAGVLLIDPYGVHIPFAVKLSFPTTNNTAEYEACIYGIEAALAAGARNLTVYGDSYLIISQTIGAWKVQDERLQMCTEYLQQFIPLFEDIEFKHLPREQNSFTDALANLAVNLTWDDDVKVQSVTIVEKEIPVVNFKPTIALLTQEDDEDAWYTDFKKYLINGEYPKESHKKDQLAIRRLASHFTILKGLLYHKSFDGNFQLCIDGEQTQRIMEEVHGGECGPLARKILRAGYYWTTLERGIDIIRKIHPKASNGHQYILVVVDYFSKWVEASSYSKLGAKQVSKFVINNIICRYGVPFEIISDNGSQFEGHLKETLEKYKIRHHQSSPYCPQTNGAVEAANKTIKTIIAKMTDRAREWPDKLPCALWGYRISIRTPTGTSPYSLVYGMDPLLPIETEIQLLRVMNESEISEEQWLKERYDELSLASERRLQALHNIQIYQRRIARAF